MTRKVAIVCSGTFPLSTAVGAQIVDTLREFGDAVFLTRGAGPCERFIAHVALALDRRCFEFKGSGGAANLDRDQELVAACDELVAFLDPNVIGGANSGAAMVVERALQAGRPVRAATVAVDTLVWAES